MAEERYQDLVEYFGDKDTAKCILEDREEFRKWLERVRWNTRKVDELARKLEQEPCEDCVSRKVVNELFDSEIKMYKERIETRKGSNYYDETERIKEFRSRIANAEYWQNKIKALPPVTPTRKKGKWEYDAYKDRSGGHCNRCGHYLRYGEKTNFCPDCGAEMEGKE